MSEFALGRVSFEAAGARGNDAGRRRPRPEIRGAEGLGTAPARGRGAGRRASVERALGLLLGAAALALAAAAAFVLVPPALRVSRYEVVGAATMSDREVLDAALVHGSEYFFALDPERVRAALLASPRIAGARVRRLFPNGLRIEVAEREAVAAVLAERNGRLETVLVDGEGVAFAFASELAGASGLPPAGLADLPLVSGLRFEGFSLGTRLPPSLVPLLASLGELEARAPSLLAAFSEIRIAKPKYGEPELVLYPLHHRVPVRTGAVLNEATLRSIILVLDVLGSRGLADGVEEIDFRRGTVVYRSKGGQSG